jgi:hypothetical protein
LLRLLSCDFFKICHRNIVFVDCLLDEALICENKSGGVGHTLTASGGLRHDAALAGGDGRMGCMMRAPAGTNWLNYRLAKPNRLVQAPCRAIPRRDERC